MCSGNEEVYSLVRFLWAKYFSPIDKDNHIDYGVVVVVAAVVVVVVVAGQLNTWKN